MRWVPQATFIMMEATQSLTAVPNLYETTIILNTMQNEPPKAYIRMLLFWMPKNTWDSSQTAGRSNKQWTWDGERGSVHFSVRLRLLSPEKQCNWSWRLVLNGTTECIKEFIEGTSLAVQWLELRAFTPKGVDSNPSWGTNPQTMLRGQKKTILLK